MSIPCPAPLTRLKKGFTLIEMMVVISIIAIIFSISVSSYVTFNRNQILQQAAEGVRSDLRLAQNKALAGQDPSSSCSAPHTLLGYRFSISGSSYSISVFCSSDDPSEPIRTPIKTVDLSSQNITLSTTPAGAKIIFLVLGRGVDLDAVAPTVLTISANNQSRLIDISPEGVIKLHN